jgi:hypothetical protein
VYSESENLNENAEMEEEEELELIEISDVLNEQITFKANSKILFSSTTSSLCDLYYKNSYLLSLIIEYNYY